METRDILVTPVIICLVYMVAFVVRPYVTDATNRRYFLPGLSVRIVGALAIGFVYQFYYQGGDTFNYHTFGSRIIWEAVTEDPSRILRFAFGSTDDEVGIYKFSSRIIFFHDPNTYFVVRIASLFDLLTFSSYSATAVLFSVFSFIGMWMLFLTFYKQYPTLHFSIAIATLFVPSVFFWGSGLLKDTVILGCLGITTYQFYQIFIERRVRISSILILLAALYIVAKVRVFVLQAYLPAIILWIMLFNFSSIKSFMLKAMAVPFFLTILLVSVYFAVVKVAEDDVKYSVKNLARTSRVTAYDIGYYTGRGAGSSYSLNITDWTPLGMVRSAPQAVNVALFRPYLWEVRNPLMLISSFESICLLAFTLYVFFRHFSYLVPAVANYNVAFCFVFSITFAFAVGISTFNFGTLARYRMPLLPFYLLALVIINDYSNKARKFRVLERTEKELNTFS